MEVLPPTPGDETEAGRSLLGLPFVLRNPSEIRIFKPSNHHREATQIGPSGETCTVPETNQFRHVSVNGAYSTVSLSKLFISKHRKQK